MTNYLPHSSKKLKILQRREAALFKLIWDGAPHHKIVAAAERVRDARIRSIEAQMAAEGPTSGRTIHDEQIEMVRQLPRETILAYFGYRQS